MAAPRQDNVNDKILDATELLLKDSSIDSISLAAIAKEAGISKGTLYYHYKSKDDILFGIAERYLAQQYHEFYQWTENAEKDTSLHRLVKYVIERSISTPPMRFHLLCDAISGNEEIRQKLIQRYTEFENLIAEKLGERTSSLPAGYFSWLILFVSDGILIQKLLKNPDVDIDAFVDATAQYVKTISKI